MMTDGTSSVSVSAPLTEEAYRLLRKKVHIELGISLAMLWLKDQKLKRYDEDHNGAWEEHPQGHAVYWEDVQALLSSASVDEIMKTCRVESADGQE